jgi:hypothetical protein
VRVVVPLTQIRKPVLSALQATGRPFELVDVSGSDRAYFDLLSRLWSNGETFCIVEHDIVIHPAALDELEACAGDWCGFPHDYHEWGEQYGLGCVKFTDRLIARNPTALRRVGVMSDERHPKRHWCRLDAWLQGVILPGSGERRCCHQPAVTHLGDGSAHGCI